jgi:uncharacterized surface protein with fasciclin (FAS1) repeats
MKIALTFVMAVSMLIALAGSALAQDASRDSATTESRDLLTVSASDESISMFVNLLRTSGLAKLLREENPLTVFALANQAFANLQKEDRKVLLTDHAALNFLLGHYIVRENIVDNDASKMSSARTLQGLKLRTELRSEGLYINGAKLIHGGIPCSNGILYTLDSFDPELVYQAVALARSNH